jgi:hypothetical protein
MSTISLTSISNGQSGDATPVNNNFTTIANAINGNLATDNMEPGGVDLTTIAEGTAWTDWAPTYAASGSMTYTTVTTTRARYIQIGKTVVGTLIATGTTGGTASRGITFILPVTAASTSGLPGCAIVSEDSGTTILAGTLLFSSTTELQIQKYDSSNFGLGSGRRVQVQFCYEAA